MQIGCGDEGGAKKALLPVLDRRRR